MKKDDILRYLHRVGQGDDVLSFVTPNGIARLVGCSKQYAHEIMAHYRDIGYISCVRVTYKAGHRDIYMSHCNVDAYLNVTAFTKEKARAVCYKGTWYLLEDYLTKFLGVNDG